MGNSTLLSIDEKLSEAIGDFIEVAVTTAIAASAVVISTNLQAYDGGQDSAFVDWWVYITDYANADVHRQVSAYATATGQLTVRGANLTTDGANKATVRLYRYSGVTKVNAINRAIEEAYPALGREIDDRTIISGNILPDVLEWWTSATALKLWTASNITLARTTTAGLTRGSEFSAKCTAGAANGYIYISSDSWPRLLDVMGTVIDFKSWAHPETADDAFLTIYTYQADTTAQTLNSTTTAPVTEFTLIELEDQSINDDIVEIQFRLRVETNGDYVYFESPRVIAWERDIREYLLPKVLQNGHIRQVYIQAEGYSDDACDDLHPMKWNPIYGCTTMTEDVNGAPYKFLILPDSVTYERQIRLIGDVPYETLAVGTDTISTDDTGQINLLVAYAAWWLFRREVQPVSSEDRLRYRELANDWYQEYQRLLSKHGKTRKPQHMNLSIEKD